MVGCCPVVVVAVTMSGDQGGGGGCQAKTKVEATWWRWWKVSDSGDNGRYLIVVSNNDGGCNNEGKVCPTVAMAMEMLGDMEEVSGDGGGGNSGGYNSARGCWAMAIAEGIKQRRRQWRRWRFPNNGVKWTKE